MLLFTHITPEDLFAVGIIPFVVSCLSVMGRIMLQAFRFKYFIREFIGRDISSTASTISARLAGEFVTQTTPSYVGGELVRIAWLTKKGVPAGKAAWLATMEIIADVLVGTMLGFVAGAVAIYNGASFIGVIVILIAIPTFVFWLVLIIFSAKRTLRLPSFSLALVQKFVAKERAERLINSINDAIADLCKMSRANFNSKRAIRTFAIGIAITFVAFLFQGLSFMVLANAVGSNFGLFESLLATSASTVLATLPITIGGSGLAELGLWAYVSDLNSIPDLDDVIKDSQLSVIIVWRIASYHVPLVIMWIALMKTIGKAPLKETRSSQYLISDKDNNDSPNSANSQNNRIDKSDNSG
jgi:glycosyltransferase 2 family protein